jgi:chromosome partitioning protein
VTGVIAILGKGGSGKTTTTALLGACVATRGESVILIDLDSTPTLTAWLAPALDDTAVTVADILRHQASIDDAILTLREHLRLLPGAPGIAALEGTISASAVHDVVHAARERAAVVLLDLRGGVASRLAAAAAAAADLVIVPIEAAPAGVRSLKLTRQLADELGRPIAGVLPTRYNSRTVVSRQLLAALDAAGFPVWEPIRQEVAVAEAPGSGELLDTYTPKSRALTDYAAAADRLLAMLKDIS